MGMVVPKDYYLEQGVDGFNVPSLLGVSMGGPYLHNGAAASLDDLLDAWFAAHTRSVNPNFVPTAEEPAAPIGVRRSSAPSGAPDRGKPRQIPPQDAPVMLVTTRPGASRSGPAGSGPAGSGGAAPQDDIEDADDPLLATRRNLEAYQRQLQGLMETLTTGTQAATSASAPGRSPVGIPPSGASPAGGSRSGGPAAAGTPSGAVPAGPLLGGGLARSATPVAVAGALPDRSLTLPRGSAFTCALETRVVSAASGFVGCRVQRNVYGDDGRVLLIERGSHLDGEYRIASLRPGAVRIPVLWTRIRTPHGVTVDVDSPGTGALGESGIDGHVDNRWGERIVSFNDPSMTWDGTVGGSPAQESSGCLAFRHN